MGDSSPAAFVWRPDVGRYLVDVMRIVVVVMMMMMMTAILVMIIDSGESF